MKARHRKLLKTAASRAASFIKGTAAAGLKLLPVFNLVFIILVLANQAEILQRLEILKAGIEIQIQIGVQDLMLDNAHFGEFMKRFGGENQGS